MFCAPAKSKYLIVHSVHWSITSSETPLPSFLPRPPKSVKCPSHPFQAILDIYWFFVKPSSPQNSDFSMNPKNIIDINVVHPSPHAFLFINFFVIKFQILVYFLSKNCNIRMKHTGLMRSVNLNTNIADLMLFSAHFYMLLVVLQLFWFCCFLLYYTYVQADFPDSMPWQPLYSDFKFRLIPSH